MRHAARRLETWQTALCRIHLVPHSRQQACAVSDIDTRRPFPRLRTALPDNLYAQCVRTCKKNQNLFRTRPEKTSWPRGLQGSISFDVLTPISARRPFLAIHRGSRSRAGTFRLSSRKRQDPQRTARMTRAKFPLQNPPGSPTLSLSEDSRILSFFCVPSNHSSNVQGRFSEQTAERRAEELQTAEQPSDGRPSGKRSGGGRPSGPTCATNFSSKP